MKHSNALRFFGTCVVAAATTQDTVNSLIFARDLFGEIRDNLYITKINTRKHNLCVPR